MKGFVSIFIFLCLVLLGAQDITNVDTYIPEPVVQLHSTDTAVKDKAIKHRQEMTFDLVCTSDYIQILSKHSRERGGSTDSSLRLFYKYHSSLLLKEYNTRQKTSELLSTSQSIKNSSLYYKYAHFVYELQQIII